MGFYFINFCVSLSALFLSVQQTTGTTESLTVASDVQGHTISTQLKYLFISCCLLRSVAYLLNGETDEGNTIFSQLTYLFILYSVASATAAEEVAENEDEEEGETNETTTIDDMLKIHKLPSWLDYDDTMYNPRPGYEPYWPVGEWVYKETFTTLYTSTSTIPPLIMGRPCPKYYRDINETCATRLSAFWKTYGCNYKNDDYNPCWGEMDQTYGYHTFPTFCGFLQYYHQFSPFHRVVFVHIGKCIIEKPFYFPFNPMYKERHVLMRYDYWMAKLNHTFFNITTERDITLGPPVVRYGDKK